MLTFKEYLIEDRITQKLDAIKNRIETGDEKDVADTGFKRDRKWNIDKQRYSKMAKVARNQSYTAPPKEDKSYGDSGLGNPEGMKTGGGSTFSG